MKKIKAVILDDRIDFYEFDTKDKRYTKFLESRYIDEIEIGVYLSPLKRSK